MPAASHPTIIPTQTVTYSRGGASFTREFSKNRGAVEATPGVEHPLVNASVGAVTSKTGVETQFWALRASLTVFHEPSGTFITATDAVHDLPYVEERDLARIHDDEVWTASGAGNTRSLATTCKAIIVQAVRECEGLSKAWKADLTGVSEAEETLRQALGTLSLSFQRAVHQSL